ncbi:MAG: hypothetical protein N2485_08480, partial [bacterium]|nr:hypothetical protein [bacterium]
MCIRDRVNIMNCKINIEDLYKEIGRMIEDIIIYNLDFPYKCYLDINNYRNDVINDYKVKSSKLNKVMIIK